MSRRAAVVALLVWTLAVTLLRAIRLPNDFAEAHWLLDYRHGLLKRGLVGEVVWSVGRVFGVRPGETTIAVLSGLVFAAFVAALLVVSLRVIARSRWSPAAVLTSVAFFSSPFVVMSAHFFGYFDSLIVLLAIVSVALVLRGRVWSAASLQTIAVLVHESSVVVGLPVVCFAWLLVRANGSRDARAPSFWPLLLPIAGLVALIASERFWLAPDVEGSLAAHLSRFQFIGGDMNLLVPRWLLTGSVENLAQLRRFGERLSSGHMHGLVLPATLAIVCYLVEAVRPRTTALGVALLAVCVAPLAMHAVAWDTARIWMFVIVASYLALWASVEASRPAERVSMSVGLIAIVAVSINVVTLSPLMDGLNERLSLSVRLLLYAPVLVACAFRGTGLRP